MSDEHGLLYLSSDNQTAPALAKSDRDGLVYVTVESLVGARRFSHGI
nr:MAG TPA: hypothetical protein [Caudoviricetes sp.]